MLDKAVGVIEDLFTCVAGLALFAMMTIVFVDVALRYLFNSPLSWSYDLVSLYLTAAIFFLGLSASVRSGSHISVDLVYRAFPARAKALADLVNAVLALLLFSALFWSGASRTIDAWRSGDVLAGSIPWPMWASAIFVPVGALLLLMRLLLLLAKAARPHEDTGPLLARDHSPSEERGL
ncbi:TRAP transporter small permease [Afifella sp. IM 167]|uniref:TRAP transporter small permease n=1 Tax=Afifella sp. IM 167 TaxID=2033586 RepID=UPI001CC97C64|nr:TRAP transporter small permease [Afifella sp. IM 167]